MTTKPEQSPPHHSVHLFRRLSAVAAVFLIVSHTGCSTASTEPALANPNLQIQFDIEQGRLDCYRHTGEPLILNSYASLATNQGIITTYDRRFRRSYRIKTIRDRIGKGRELRITFDDMEELLDFDLILSLYEQSDFFTIEVQARNVSQGEVGITAIHPLRALTQQGGGLHLGGDGRAYKVSTQGYKFTDQGTLSSLPPDTDVGSWWNVTVYDTLSRKSFVAGYITNNTSESFFKIHTHSAPTHPGDMGNAIDFEAHSTFGYPGAGQGRNTWNLWTEVKEEGFPIFLQPGETISSDIVMLAFGAGPRTVLEKYAQVLGQMIQFEARLPIAMGWVSWDYYKTAVSEADVLENADFITENLLDYGVEYVQVDEGWQVHRGVWEAYDVLFPHGMKWLAEQIHNRGLKAGIWVAPYQINEASDVFRDHKDWLLKNQDGSLRVSGRARLPLRSQEGRNIYHERGSVTNLYGLDVTHPEARKWLYDLFKRMADDWGYDFFKIDFAYRSILRSQGFYDRSKSEAQAYRLGLQTIRDAIGADRYLLDCGPRTGAGIADASRINLDSQALWPSLTWSNGQGRAISRSYYRHRQLWYNDPDMLMVRPPLSLEQARAADRRQEALKERLEGGASNWNKFAVGGLTLDQSRAITSAVAFSGGQFMSSDNLPELPPERLAILQSILPVFGEAARPLDLFENEFPASFHLKVKKDFDSWDVLAVVNWDESNSADKIVSFAQMSLDTTRTFLVYEFWNQEFLGEFKENLNISLKPSSAMVMAIHEKQAVPQVISTSRHITQGGVELVEAFWELQTRTLRGRAKGIKGTEYAIVIYVPDGYISKEALVNGLPSHVDMDASHIHRLSLSFDETSTLTWSIIF